MPTTYGYARVSTDDQTTALQLDALRAAGVSEVYADEAVSGTTAAAERRELRRLLAILAPGDTLVVYSVSRVGRSTADVLSLLESLGRRGVLFRSLTEPFDTTTGMGKFVLTILAAVADLERSMLSERTKAGLSAARARGAKIGRPTTGRAAEARALVRESGYSTEAAAAELGVSVSSVRRALRA